MTVKMEPVDDDNCGLSTRRPFNMTDEQIDLMRQGTWSVSGTAQVAYFFTRAHYCFTESNKRSELSENATPPALSQGDVVSIELCAYWLLQGTEVQCDLVDTDMNTVTRYVCKVNKVDCPQQAIMLDDPSPQRLVRFDITLLPFAMDQICELCIRLTVTRRTLPRMEVVTI